MELPLLLTDKKGTGRTIVLVPGGLTGWRSWMPHQEILAKHYCAIRTQLFAVESGLRNEPLPHNYSLQWECDALAKTIDGFGSDRFDIAAWSFGAAISLSYAIHHPERIRTLTLIEPPAIWLLRSRAPLSPEMEAHRKAIAKLAPGPVTDDELAWFTHFAGFVPPDVDPRTLPPWNVWSQHMQSLRNGDAAFSHEDDISLVRNFPHPVLLYKGTGSSTFLHDIIDILAEELPNAVVKELPGRHSPHIASMPQFMEAFTGFIEAH